MEQLKRDLFNILAYIVEDTIKDDGIDKIIKKQILPAFSEYENRIKSGRKERC